MNLELLIRFAALGHLIILIAGLLAPFALDWKTALAPLHPFLRQLFWTYGAFILLTNSAFAILGWAFAADMAAGTGAARGLAAFIAVYWLARLLIQFLVFKPGDFLASPWKRIGYHALTPLFAFFVLTFGAAAAGIRF